MAKQKNPTIRQWIDTAKPVAFWILIVAISYQFANAILVHNVFFPSGMFHPLHRATGGILSSTFQGYVLLTIVTGFFLCYLGGLRAKDFALFSKKIFPAIGLTLFAWGMIHTIPFLEGQALQINSDWDTLEAARHRFSRFFMSQLFGNALYEELFFRAFLISQLTLFFLKKMASTPAILFAIICSCIIFALFHIPVRLIKDISIEVILLEEMLDFFLRGLGFAVIFLLTKNIFVAVGIHALSNASPDIFANIGQNREKEFIVVLLICFFLRWCYRKWQKVEVENADTTGYKCMLIALSLVAVFSNPIYWAIHSLLGHI
tara:strand:+ start:2514 stop:3467 length:954 start_codon:yes stop_codon:yes gene_type:complete